jgi:uncharacterized repeat protein (TIGR01451 family)
LPFLVRAIVATAVALTALLALQAARAAAVPGTQVWTGQASGPTPDINDSGFTFLDTAGDPIPASGIAGTLNFTVDGVPRVGYCIDTSRRFATAPTPADIVTENPPATAAKRAATWILLNRTPTGAPTPEKQDEAAISQIAVWLLLDAQINKTTPTSDPAANAAALALVQEALAATATPSSLTVSASAPAAGATTSTLTLTGKPGAVVTLSVTGGSGTLSAGQVTIGAGGTATVTLTSPGPGTTTVAASTAGDGSYVAINPSTGSQSTATATPTTLTASVSVAFRAAQVTPTTPTVPIAGSTAPRLRLTKTAPARARVLTRVRYTITVRNPGRVAARNVVLKDRLPKGMSFVRSSRRGTLSGGVVTYDLGTIGAGKSKRVYVWLMADADVRGTRVNVATVTATRVRQLTARAATVFRPLARRVQPAVTG